MAVVTDFVDGGLCVAFYLFDLLDLSWLPEKQGEESSKYNPVKLPFSLYLSSYTSKSTMKFMYFWLVEVLKIGNRDGVVSNIFPL